MPTWIHSLMGYGSVFLAKAPLRLFAFFPASNLRVLPQAVRYEVEDVLAPQESSPTASQTM
jgi:hypothetical protein